METTPIERVLYTIQEVYAEFFGLPTPPVRSRSQSQILLVTMMCLLYTSAYLSFDRVQILSDRRVFKAAESFGKGTRILKHSHVELLDTRQSPRNVFVMMYMALEYQDEELKKQALVSYAKDKEAVRSKFHSFVEAKQDEVEKKLRQIAEIFKIPNEEVQHVLNSTFCHA